MLTIINGLILSRSWCRIFGILPTTWALPLNVNYGQAGPSNAMKRMNNLSRQYIIGQYQA